MLSIHEVATKFDITYDALRYYEKQGLLLNIQRDEYGRRIYSDENLDDLDKLLHLRKLGATVEETKNMLNLFRRQDKTAETYDTGIQFLEHLDDELDLKIASLEQQKEFLSRKIARFESEKNSLKKSTATNA